MDEELRLMRLTRSRGCIPNPNKLTGERREWVLEMERLFERVAELDSYIFGESSPSKPKTQAHLCYMGHFSRQSKFAGLSESLPIFPTQEEAMGYADSNLGRVDRGWCHTIPVVVITPAEGEDAEEIKTAFPHLFSKADQS